MKVNSVLTLKVHSLDEVNRTAAVLRTMGFETKVSSTTEQAILATNALPRSLKKARAAAMNKSQNVVAFMKMMELASAGAK